MTSRGSSWTWLGRASVAVLPACLAIACVSGGGGARPVVTAPPQSSAQAASPLEGEWRLSSFQLADGSTRRVTGYLRFDRFSTITVHAELAPDDPAARPPRTVVADFTAKASPNDGQFDFVGLSTNVGVERLVSDAVQMNEWRHYELAGDTLRLQVRDRAGRSAATLTFTRP